MHGSFGSGKSHFLTVLHAILNDHPAARAKQGLQGVIADHDDWLRHPPGRGFLMVPYHLVGACDIGSAILGEYVATLRRLYPGQWLLDRCERRDLWFGMRDGFLSPRPMTVSQLADRFRCDDDVLSVAELYAADHLGRRDATLADVLEAIIGVASGAHEPSERR